MSDTQSTHLGTPTQILHRGANGITFANPKDPNYTVRFKHSRARKRLNGMSVENYIEEIIINDLVGVTVAGKPTTDAVSVRIRISGSAEAHVQIKRILKNLAAQLPAWADENVALGFEPSVPPKAIKLT